MAKYDQKRPFWGPSWAPWAIWTGPKVSNWPLQVWDIIFNLVHPVSNSFGAARTTYGQTWPNMTKNGHFGGHLGPPGPFGRVQRDPIGPSRCEISFSILFIQYPTHLGQLGPPMGNYGQIWLKMAVLGAFLGPQGHFWWTHKGPTDPLGWKIHCSTMFNQYSTNFGQLGPLTAV